MPTVQMTKSMGQETRVVMEIEMSGGGGPNNKRGCYGYI